jgi:hypothetical protein
MIPSGGENSAKRRFLIDNAEIAQKFFHGSIAEISHWVKLKIAGSCGCRISSGYPGPARKSGFIGNGHDLIKQRLHQGIISSDKKGFWKSPHKSSIWLFRSYPQPIEILKKFF